MRRKLMFTMKRFFLIVFLLTGLFSPAIFAEKGRLKIYVNGRPIGFSAVEKHGIAYVPLIPMAIALKISILWNPSSKTIGIAGKSYHSVALFSRGILYVPLEAVATAIKAPVELKIKNGKFLIELHVEKHEAQAAPLLIKSSNPAPTPSQALREEGFFAPKTAADAYFSVTVTDMETRDLIRDYYKPRGGDKFVVLHVSEQNISNQIQMYTGQFTLKDSNGNSYNYLDGLSTFFLQILRPGGINFGSLVFEIPDSESPAELILHTYGNLPLTVSLR